jgi:hypothetical protein
MYVMGCTRTPLPPICSMAMPSTQTSLPKNVQPDSALWSGAEGPNSTSHSPAWTRLAVLTRLRSYSACHLRVTFEIMCRECHQEMLRVPHRSEVLHGLVEAALGHADRGCVESRLGHDTGPILCRAVVQRVHMANGGPLVIPSRAGSLALAPTAISFSGLGVHGVSGIVHCNLNLCNLLILCRCFTLSPQPKKTPVTYSFEGRSSKMTECYRPRNMRLWMEQTSRRQVRSHIICGGRIRAGISDKPKESNEQLPVKIWGVRPDKQQQLKSEADS